MIVQDPELVRQWAEDGYAVLSQVIPHDLIDRLNADVAGFRASSGETRDEHGYGQRIGLLHVQNQHSLAVALNPKVREFLRWAMNDDPLLFGSLTFEVGTEQGAHQDSIYFWTEPDAAMAGVWVALEDVREEAGPLFYYRGSHRWGVFRAEDCWRARPDLRDRLQKLSPSDPDYAGVRAQIAGELGNVWYQLMEKRVAESGMQPTPVLIQKGDALVWHAHLVHGGLRRADRALTRRSMVTHHIGRRAAMFDMNTYFCSTKDRFDSKSALVLGVIESPIGPYVQHERPVTY